MERKAAIKFIGLIQGLLEVVACVNKILGSFPLVDKFDLIKKFMSQWIGNTLKDCPHKAYLE
jgi:hypothetical protein